MLFSNHKIADNHRNYNIHSNSNERGWCMYDVLRSGVCQS